MSDSEIAELDNMVGDMSKELDKELEKEEDTKGV